MQSRFGAHSFLLAAAMVWLLFSSQVRAGQPWEVWSRLGLSKDMTTEWLVADDKDFESIHPPEQTTIYLLVPPTITEVGHHWEITFNGFGQKKKLLAEHFDNTQAFKPWPDGFHAFPKSEIAFHMDYRRFWLIIHSKEYGNHKFNQPNVDPDKTGTPYAFNLDPDDSLGIAFLEPRVTEKDGEWILTTSATPTDDQKAIIAENYDDWMQHHPGPQSPTHPADRYPPKLQKQYDAWWKAVKEWQQAPQGNTPELKDFMHLTPAQQKQEKEWEHAKSIWFITGGEQGPYPQPDDFIKEDEL
jgi:hypothetical protein